MTRKIFAAAVCALACFAAGCSFTNNSTQVISLTVIPADATVIANGVEYHNVSPQFLEVNPSRELLLIVYKPGFREKLYTVGTQLSSTGKIDAFGSIFVLPFFGLFANGAWELKETNIFIELEPLPPKKTIEKQQEQTLQEKGMQRSETDFREEAIRTGMPPAPPAPKNTEKPGADAKK